MGINHFKLRDLVDRDRMEWRKSTSFVSKILSIHIRRVRGPDEVYWSCSKDGKFSVRTA